MVSRSLVLVKNSVIELSVDKKIKSQYLGLIIVIKWLIPYLACKKIVFVSELRVLLDILESFIEELEKYLVKKVLKESSLIDGLE